MTNDNLSRELERMAGSPELAEAVKASLEKLSSGVAGADLAEMAHEVLKGRASLRSAANSSAYADSLTEATTRFQDFYEDLDPGERQALIADAGAYITSTETNA